jgi:hypothetical protein
MRLLKVIGLIFSIGSAPYPLMAATYDGSAPLLCAVMHVMECEAASDCQQTTAENVNLALQHGSCDET